MSRVPWLVLLCALFVVGSSLCAQQAMPQQSSTQNLQQAEPLWQTLLALTNGLPSQIDSLQASSLAQINSLIASNAQLQISNSELQTSNDSLSQSNEDLRTSLQASQADLATSEQQRRQLQTDLDASTQSITQAQEAAKGLESEIGWLKVGLYVAVPVALMGAAYMTGHLLLHWW